MAPQSISYLLNLYTSLLTHIRLDLILTISRRNANCLKHPACRAQNCRKQICGSIPYGEVKRNRESLCDADPTRNKCKRACCPLVSKISVFLLWIFYGDGLLYTSVQGEISRLVWLMGNMSTELWQYSPFLTRKWKLFLYDIRPSTSYHMFTLFEGKSLFMRKDFWVSSSDAGFIQTFTFLDSFWSPMSIKAQFFHYVKR